MSKYSDIVEASYGAIKPDGTIDENIKDDILELLDAEWADENVKSKILIWFDCEDGSFLGTGDGRSQYWRRGYDSKWIPNHGVDVNLPCSKQNDQNGIILENVSRQSFSFNDIITYSSITSSTHSGRAARMHFTSHRLKQDMAIMVNDFSVMAKKMTKGIVIGRFCFKGTGGLMTIKPLEYR